MMLDLSKVIEEDDPSMRMSQRDSLTSKHLKSDF